MSENIQYKEPIRCFQKVMFSVDVNIYLVNLEIQVASTQR